MPAFKMLLIPVFLFTQTLGFADEPRQNRGAAKDKAITQQDEAIDFDRARTFLQKKNRGEQLTAEEQAYLQRAMDARRRMDRGQQQRGRDERVLPASEASGLKPLDQMTANDRYLDEDGGLYGKGMNEPPERLRNAASRQLSKIVPLDAEGKPSPQGKVVLVSISMSNATQEFSRFKQIADRDPDKSPQLTIVDCAQGGQAMAEWVSPDAQPWAEAMRRIERTGVTPAQVQVAWVKLANKGPRGDLPTHGGKLQSDTAAVIKNAKARFPNLRIVYLSSRIYGGHSDGSLNPEPYAYESAFVARRLIQDQFLFRDDAGNALKPGDDGSTDVPLLLWGPYLWADGITPRQSDGLTWKREDLGPDGTHPSQSGRDKVATMLLTFFKESPLARSWFLGLESDSRRN